MQLNSKTFKRCDLLEVSGRVDSATAPQLQEGINSITDTGKYKIVLDFSNVEFVSSAGLRVLINSQKTCKKYNRGDIYLAAVPENVYTALDLAGFTTLFTVFEDVLTAVGNF